MTKPRDFDALKAMVETGEIDTVLVCLLICRVA